MLDAFRGTERFHIVKELGIGGMGTVYEAFDREHNQPVALKLLQRLDPQALLRFKNEYRAARDVVHPNLVRLGDLVEDKGRWFFTMELVHGVDFTLHVRPEGVLDQARLRSCVKQLASALLALHRGGQVHRDIKPSNVMVTDEGRLVLLDFGVARHLDSQGMSSGAVVGTSEYMAPEQAMGHVVGPAADWYAVGILLYEGLVGVVPFTGSHVDICIGKYQRDPPPPRATSPDVPEDLDHLCVALLSRDPDTRATGQDILTTLGAAQPTEQRPPAGRRERKEPDLHFIGRHNELSFLDDAFKDSRATPVTAYIRGQSGVGKTALVEQFRARVRTQDDSALVLYGRCFERESVPYKAIDAAIDALTRWLAGLDDSEVDTYLPDDIGLLAKMFPVLRRVRNIARSLRPITDQMNPSEIRTRAMAALKQLMGRVSENHPLVLAIDDIQWADADSRALTQVLLGPPDVPRFLAIMTERTSSSAEAEHHSSSWVPGEVRVLELDNLANEEATELMSRLLSDAGVDSGEAETLASSAGGHPVFIHELVRAIARDRDAAPVSNLDELLKARISRLDPSAQLILDVLSVAAGSLPQLVASVAGKLNFGEFIKVSRMLVEEQLVRTNGSRRDDTIELYHDRVRNVLIGRLDGSAIRGLHEDLALSFEMAAHDDLERLAYHWTQAGKIEKGREAAIAAAERAAQVLSFDRAARLYQQALASGSEDESLAIELAECLINAGRCNEAGKVLLGIAGECEPEDAAAITARAAEQFLRSGYIDKGLKLLEGVVAEFDLTLPKHQGGSRLDVRKLWRRVVGNRLRERPAGDILPRDLSRIDLLAGAVIGLVGVEEALSRRLQSEHLWYAMRAGELTRAQRALSLELLMAGGSGSAGQQRRARLQAQLKSLTERVDTPYARAIELLARGCAAVQSGEFRDGDALLTDSQDLFEHECSGVSKELDVCVLHRLQALSYLGEISTAESLLAQALYNAQQRGDLYAASTFPLGPVNLIWLAADDPDEAKDRQKRAGRMWSSSGFNVQHYLTMVARCGLELYNGQAAQAIERLGGTIAELRRSRIDNSQYVRVQVADLRGRAYVMLAMKCDSDADRAECVKRATGQIRLLDREGADWAKALAAGIRASTKSLDHAARPRDWREAATLFEAVHMEQYAAACQWRAAALDGGDGGDEAMAAAEQRMTSRGVKTPRHFISLLAPAPAPAD